MTAENALEFILKNASANIRYRVKRDILGEDIGSGEMLCLQEEITALPRVKKVLAAQREDGFFGKVIHGSPVDGFDSDVGFLKTNGVEVTNPAMVRAKECLLNWKDYEKDHFYKAGNAMDEHGRGGFRAVWADVLVELAAEEADESAEVVANQVECALSAFDGALEQTCIDDFTRELMLNGEKRRYYVKGAAFPAANHVSILEKTLSWRSEENLEMVRKSYRHCAEIMKDYDGGCIYIRCPHAVGPFNYNWRGAYSDLQETHGAVSAFSPRQFDGHPIDFAWFMAGLSSAKVSYPVFGVEHKSDVLAESLRLWIAEDGFMDSISAEEMRMFKKYAAVEPGWRREESVMCDVLFPVVCGIYGRKAE